MRYKRPIPNSQPISRRKALSLGLGSLLAGAIPLPFTRVLAFEEETAGVREHIKAASAALDQQKLVSLAMDLCNIPSFLGHERKLAEFLHQRMQAEGLVSRLQNFAPDRSNVLGIHRGKGGGHSLMFNGHLDTMPLKVVEVPLRQLDAFAHEQTASVPPARIVDGDWISGTGIWNMRGSLAAYVAAVSAVRKAGIPLAGDVLIAGVAGGHDQTVVDSRIKGEDFEGFSIGTRLLLNDGGVADMCVVGEPTSFKLIRQHLGTTAIRIDVAVQSPFPEVIDDLVGSPQPEQLSEATAAPSLNAIELAAEIVEALRAWIPDYRRRNRFARVDPSVNIAAVEGGLPWTVRPTECTLYIFVGTPPSADQDGARREIERVLASVQAKHPDLRASARNYSVNPGSSVRASNPLVTALKIAHTDVFRRPLESAVVGWHSAASPLTNHGIPSVTYGPTGKMTMDAEFVRIQDLVDCTRVFIDLIVRTCTGSEGQITAAQPALEVQLGLKYTF